MQDKSVWIEFHRWSFACLPGVVFKYAQELDLDIEDIGIFTALFYTLEQSHPLYRCGINIGQVLQTCPVLSKQKLSKKLNRLEHLGVIAVNKDNGSFADRVISLEPLMDKLEMLVSRDHPRIKAGKEKTDAGENIEQTLDEYRERIVQLELQLEEEKEKKVVEITGHTNVAFKKVADFISKKTGNLMSVKMSNELRKWLDDMGFTQEFLLCMLELCFERNIYNPRDISKIAADLKEYAIHTVEGLELYFKNYVDNEKISVLKLNQFDPDVIAFGQNTGIDMSASARKKVYYKWRYDWGFSHAMIMKAGEIMCQRTRNGGLEYIDSVLHNWMSKEIRQVEDADKEIEQYRQKQKNERNNRPGAQKKNSPPPASSEYELYVPPGALGEFKSKV